MRDIRAISTTINPNGSITVAEVIDGYREHMTYYGYSEDRAIEMFKSAFPLKPTKTIKVCTECGSPRVFADAWQNLNDEDDVRTFDDKFCEDCDGECRVEDVEIPDDFNIEEDTYTL